MSDRWSRALRVLLGVGVLALVVFTIDPVQAAGLLARANLLLVLLGVAGLTAVHLVAASAWRSLLAILAGIRLPWTRAIATFYAAQAIGGVTPANVGGDLHRAVALRSAGLSWTASVAPLIVQRATSYVALGALSVVAMVVLASSSALAMPLVGIGLLTAVVVGLGAWLVLVPPPPLAGAGAWLMRRLGGTPGVELGRVSGVGRATTLGLGSGVAFHALSVGLTFLLILAIDPLIPTVPVLAAITVARLSLAVPITPSGLGVQEGVLAVLFGSVGLSPGTAVAGLLLGRLALVLTTGIGVWLLFRSDRGPVVVEGGVGQLPVAH
ncbi:MAG: lysylphosphatidylglycerol synthase transmembrane domain-containing protein [Candidatus Limnocylindria bacterium]